MSGTTTTGDSPGINHNSHCHQWVTCSPPVKIQKGIKIHGFLPWKWSRHGSFLNSYVSKTLEGNQLQSNTDDPPGKDSMTLYGHEIIGFLAGYPLVIIDGLAGKSPISGGCSWETTINGELSTKPGYLSRYFPRLMWFSSLQFQNDQIWYLPDCQMFFSPRFMFLSCRVVAASLVQGDKDLSVCSYGPKYQF